jgi:hypothetical protein
MIGLIKMISRKYDKEIYGLKEIKNAINAYIDYADISFKETDVDYVCNFSNCKFDENQTVNEFSNYVIACMNTRNRE